MLTPRTRAFGAGCSCLARLSVVLLCAAGPAGCGLPANREQLVKEVLKADPAFGEVMEKHRELSNRLETHQKELALKRSTVKQTIAKMRKDLAAAAASIRARSAETRQKMDPDRKRLRLTVSMAGEELQARRVQRASLGRSITKLRKAIESKDAAWTEKERAQQQAQMEEMAREVQRLDHEMAALKEHLRLLKIKLVLIKL